MKLNTAKDIALNLGSGILVLGGLSAVLYDLIGIPGIFIASNLSLFSIIVFEILIQISERREEK